MPFIEKYLENLKAALQTSHVKEIIKMEEFYIQKAKDKFDEFSVFDITNVDVNGMIEASKVKKYSFMATLNSYNSNSTDYRFLLIVGQLITYCDTHGANKHEFNEYADKRAISRANVRQNNWVRWLIEFRIGTDINLMPSSIKNTIQYLQKPEKNLSISSEDWRKKILKALFQNESGNLFEEMHSTEIVADNPLNNGVLYSWICWSDPIKQLWDATTSNQKNTWWPSEDEIEQLVLKMLGGLKKTHIILTRAPLYEINDGSKVLIQHYTYALEDCDVCIFLIDNYDGVPLGVQKEIDTARKYEKKSLFYFCDQQSKEETPLQKSLKGSQRAKSKSIHDFKDFIENGAEGFLNDLINVYKHYWKGRLEWYEESFP